VAIAGHFDLSTGAPLEVKPMRLKNTGDREGLTLELYGGKDPFKKAKGVQQIKQKAIIELLCNRKKSGWEPSPDPSESSLSKRDEDDGAPEENVGSALTFKSYDLETTKGEEWKVLKLQWETKYACEDASSITPPQRSTHWGFFTWLIIM
jgi:hypothetical protein